MSHYTRFRAYQLGEEGSSFSLSVDNHFTLIEAKINQTNIEHISWELSLLNKRTIDTLHITSWDTDHCDNISLENILLYLKPARIEYPGYEPESDTGKECKLLIENYNCNYKFKLTPLFVKLSQSTKERLKGKDVLFNPVRIVEKHNDNSVVKFFRVGSFQVLSLGDCEDESISTRLLEDEILQNEVDVLILAHHGSENSICTMEFLHSINPKVAICSSNYDNKFDHPHAVIRQRLNHLGIPLFTTKTGDIIAQTIDKYSFKVSNYISNNEHKESSKIFTNKTYYIND